MLALGAAIALHYGCLHLLQTNTPAVFFFLYLAAIVIAGWCGYGPGVLVILVAVAGVPFLFRPGFTLSQINFRIAVSLLLVSLLISHTSGVRRRSEQTLRLLNEDLDRRVRERTAELHIANARLEDALSETRSARDSLKTTLASIGDAVISTDAMGRVVFANAVAQALLGCGESDLLGEPLDEVFRIVNENTGVAVESPVAQVLREGRTVGLANHTVLLALDGREIPIDDSGAPIRGEDGNIRGTVLVFRDVTERRRAEATSRLLASIVASSDDAIVSKDLNGIVTSWNRGAERLYGYSAEEMIGQSIDLLTPEDRLEETPGILKRIRGGQHIEQLLTVRRTKSGGSVNVSLAVSPIHDALGRVVGASRIARDVTEQVRTAQRLAQLNADLKSANEDLAWSNEEAQRARDSLKTTLASIGDAVIATNAQGAMVFSNTRAQELLRASEPDLVGKHLDQVFQIVNEETGAIVESPLARVLREGAAVDSPHHTILIARDGTETPIDESGAPIRNERGEITGVVLTFRDMTERRKAAQALQAAQAQLQLITDTMAASVSRCSRDRRYIWVSPRYAEWLGKPASTIAGRPISEVLGPEGYATISPFIDRVLAGERTEYEIQVRYRTIGQRWIHATYVPTYDEQHAVNGWVAQVSDITALKEAEAELARVNTQLRESNESLAQSNDDLERFAFVASHDFQEPLRMITTFTQLLVKSYPTPDKDAAMFVHNIVDGTTRMRDLLADLLTYTEIDTRAEETARAVDLNVLVEHVRANLAEAIGESGAAIAVDHLPTLSVPEGHVLPLFQNLISNAIKYRSDVPPRIHIRAQEADGELRFSVTDNGVGIKPQYHEQIFGVFKRLHGRSIPGSGVGLAICQRVVKRYGGRIWVESEAGQGATFFFTLPNVAVSTAKESTRG